HAIDVLVIQHLSEILHKFRTLALGFFDLRTGLGEHRLVDIANGFDLRSLFDRGDRVVFPLIAAADQSERDLLIGAKGTSIEIQKTRGNGCATGLKKRSAVLAHITSPYNAARRPARGRHRLAHRAPTE